MKIRKAFQGTVPENKILDTYSTSQTDTYSCNYVNNKFEWKFLGSRTSSNKIALPSNYNELLIIARWQTLSFPMIIPKIYIDTLSNEHGFNTGYFKEGTSGGRFNVHILNGEMWLYEMYINSGQEKTNTTTYWYYR